MLDILHVLLTVLLVLDGIVLVILILMQKTKGAEIGAVFGSGAAAAVFGAGASNVLTKITYWLGGLFLALVLSLSLIDHYKQKTKKSIFPVEHTPTQTQKSKE